jgi:hypothetical protein
MCSTRSSTLYTTRVLQSQRIGFSEAHRRSRSAAKLRISDPYQDFPSHYTSYKDFLGCQTAVNGSSRHTKQQFVRNETSSIGPPCAIFNVHAVEPRTRELTCLHNLDTPRRTPNVEGAAFPTTHGNEVVIMKLNERDCRIVNQERG